jgi:hypothetical protein
VLIDESNIGIKRFKNQTPSVAISNPIHPMKNLNINPKIVNKIDASNSFDVINLDQEAIED